MLVKIHLGVCPIASLGRKWLHRNSPRVQTPRSRRNVRLPVAMRQCRERRAVPMNTGHRIRPAAQKNAENRSGPVV